MKIAILGAAGHLSKCAFWVFSRNEYNEIYLYSRFPDRLKGFSKQSQSKNVILRNYADFFNADYDIIFNGVGTWDTPGANADMIFEITEYYDNMVIKYQTSHSNCTSVHISSGAAYASDFLNPVDFSTKTQITINNFAVGDYYSIAKINSEAKHRAHSGLNIVDLRLFGFFSRFMSLEYKYLLSGLINAVKNRTVFHVIKENFWRDYIHLDDFSMLLLAIAAVDKINTAIDVRSRQPVSKEEIIKLFTDKYNLKIESDINVEISKTGVKPHYYSVMNSEIYSPRYTSLETIQTELQYFFGGIL
jgi:nucleoside-diphosphate-sugar epimerase